MVGKKIYVMIICYDLKNKQTDKQTNKQTNNI